MEMPNATANTAMHARNFASTMENVETGLLTSNAYMPVRRSMEKARRETSGNSKSCTDAMGEKNSESPAWPSTSAKEKPNEQTNPAMKSHVETQEKCIRKSLTSILLMARPLSL